VVEVWEEVYEEGGEVIVDEVRGGRRRRLGSADAALVKRSVSRLLRRPVERVPRTVIGLAPVEVVMVEGGGDPRVGVAAAFFALGLSLAGRLGPEAVLALVELLFRPPTGRGDA